MTLTAPRCPLRVITVNIHKGYTTFNRRYMLKELRDAVRSVHSDLVFLQETTGEPVRARRFLRGAPVAGRQYEFLADQIWSDHAYGRNAVADGLDHGNAVLSRFPILHSRNHDVSQRGDEPRGLLHCVVQAPDGGAPVHAICVHLSLREWQRERQFRRLRELLDDEVPPDAPLIVAGDFNDWRQRADAALQGTGLVEVFREHQGAHARSFPARLPVLRLDRIYVRRVASAAPLPLPRHPWATLSDHAPLAADIRL